MQQKKTGTVSSGSFAFFEENMKKGLNIYAYKRIIQTSRKQTGGVTMSNILKVARLIRALEEEDRDIELKVEIIKMYRKMGIITEDDAIELAVEYC